MASIVERNNRYCVVYNFRDKKGNRKQKWESFNTRTEAEKRRREVDDRDSIDEFLPPKCKKLEDLIPEYVELYGKVNWSIATYSSNMGLIKNYILPFLGNMELTEISTRTIDRYYQKLLKTKAVENCYTKRPHSEYVTSSTVRVIHKLLRSCFGQAEKWELIEKNPCLNATVPKHTPKKRAIWDSDTLFKAINLCKDERLKLAINLAFCCSLRMGEMLGLTWDCIDISEEAIQNGTTNIYIDKEIQRALKKAVKDMEGKDIIKVFPSRSSSDTVIILKTPKTETSVRRVYLPSSVAEMLVEWKKQQDERISYLEEAYSDYNLVFTQPYGEPVDGAVINKSLRTLIKENNLPEVVFHSLRHTSITYKLKLNGGDIKSVQGDSGHAQATMVTEQYSHILDADRKRNAQLFEENFYSGKDKNTTAASVGTTIPGVDSEKMAKLLSNPTVAALLATLAEKME